MDDKERDKEQAEVSRREFLRVAGASAAGLLVGCGGGRAQFPGQQPDDGGTGTDGDGDAGAIDAGDGGGIVDSGADARPDMDATPECLETLDNPLGPFYSEGAPERSAIAADDEAGTVLTVRGRVLDPECAPLAGAVLDVWQANDEGAYDNVGYTLRGKVAADADGRYEFTTIVPGHYLNGSQYRPAHIHVTVTAPGAAELTTQLYFPDDPYNDIDGMFRDELVMEVEDVKGGGQIATFDFVLRPA